MFVYPKKYDVIVVGGGHAGIEAALASARMGCETLLVTTNLDTIGQMSCNPAIGGLAKGHLVREIDALGGEMGRTTDMTGLQFRMLNTKKGPAVWSPRAQCDKKAYQFRMKWACERQPRLDCKQAQVQRLVVENDAIKSVQTNLEVEFACECLVITTGTFLQGLIHLGPHRQAGGRAGEAASVGVSRSLNDLGLELGRLKTGTPPRIARSSIDFRTMDIQPGDVPVPYFSFWKSELFHVEHAEPAPGDPAVAGPCYPPGSILEKVGRQLPCYLTHTTERTQRVIHENLHKSAMYSGAIEGVGPRYCPSIEDKIVRFADKASHQVFLEPEGIQTEEYYVNGLSTSMPYDVQLELVRTVVGCEAAEMSRPAYAVEYDFAFPTQLSPSLETKVCRNLFLAGQINGTSGYEEAAAQGLVAGINAARRCQSRSLLGFGRNEAYLGVLIDDLVTKGTAEPYRMFTSRAEYRLLLRQDNADSRLAGVGHQIGLLPGHLYAQVVEKESQVREEIARLASTRTDGQTLLQLLRRSEFNYSNLPGRKESLPQPVAEEVTFRIKYEGYVLRQEAEIEKLRSIEDKEIPVSFDYNRIPSLKTEARVKLSQIRPATLGQASRISGVTPSDISILSVFLKRSTSA